MVKPLRVAAIGAGYFSQFQYEAWKRMDDVELVATCNRTESKAREFAQTYDIPNVFCDVEKMLREIQPDLVDIITPPETHLEYIQIASHIGIPMICQKPFTPDLTTAQQAVQAANEAGILLVIHENFRFQPWYEETRNLIRQDVFGEIYSVTYRLRPGDGQGPEAYLSRQPYFQKMPRFLIHETGIHLIDTFRSMLGEVTSIYAQLRKLNPVIAGEDAGFVLFDFENGSRGFFDGNRLVDHEAENKRLTMGEMWLEGSDAVLRLNGNGQLLLRPHGGYESEIDYDWNNHGFGGDCVYLFQRHVVDHMLYQKPIINTGEDYLTNLRIEEAVYQSNQIGKKIDL